MASTNTLGKYEILREIARSNDIVYEAVDPALGRHVALKELYIPPNLTGAQKRERIERFLREGKAAGQLAHPNIVTIYDVGQEGDRFYIAMEFLEGQTLRDVLQVRGALPVKEAVDIALQICNALAYAHQHNVVHRDVKPENVQLLPGGHVKLTDFGIARIMSEPSITADGQVFGTPSYMSPEQVAGKHIDGRSDLFSLGVVLYEMLAGHKPFAGDTVVTITYNIMNSEPAPPPGISPHLIAVIRRAMAKDADMRCQTAEEMANDLRNEPPNGALLYGDPFSTSASPGHSPTYGGRAPPTYGPAPGPYPPRGQPSGSYSPIPPPPGAPPGQAVPDPFAQAPTAPVPPSAPPVPRQPILSAETKAFLGAALLVIGLVGLLVFAVYAVNQAYDAYVERTAQETSERYIAQGDKLYAQGDVNAALDQYLNAVRAAGGTKAAGPARRKLASVYADLAHVALGRNDYGSALSLGSSALETDPSYSAGHYFVGAGSYYSGDGSRAEAELRKAIDIGGNDSFAIAARKLLSRLLVEKGDMLARSGRQADAAAAYNSVVELGDPDWIPVAQDHLRQLQGG